jgi:hypothetical protein
MFFMLHVFSFTRALIEWEQTNTVHFKRTRYISVNIVRALQELLGLVQNALNQLKFYFGTNYFLTILGLTCRW